MTTQAIAAGVVARMLDKSLDWFYRHHDRLQREHRFPAPLAGVRGRWSRAAVARWIDGDPTPPSALVVDQAELDARADEIVAALLEGNEI